MRIYIKKTKDGINIYKETFLESIVSDFITSLVMILLMALDIIFSIYITHSIIIDAMVVILLFFYISSWKGRKQKIKTKEELKKILFETNS